MNLEQENQQLKEAWTLDHDQLVVKNQQLKEEIERLNKEKLMSESYAQNSLDRYESLKLNNHDLVEECRRLNDKVSELCRDKFDLGNQLKQQNQKIIEIIERAKPRMLVEKDEDGIGYIAPDTRDKREIIDELISKKEILDLSEKGLSGIEKSFGMTKRSENKSGKKEVLKDD
jgi:hypothetical protein